MREYLHEHLRCTKEKCGARKKRNDLLVLECEHALQPLHVEVQPCAATVTAAAAWWEGDEEHVPVEGEGGGRNLQRQR